MGDLQGWKPSTKNIARTVPKDKISSTVEYSRKHLRPRFISSDKPIKCRRNPGRAARPENLLDDTSRCPNVNQEHLSNDLTSPKVLSSFNYFVKLFEKLYLVMEKCTIFNYILI